jgi:hemoglobin/transferrin/lactoferrin receptor protein
VSVVLAAPAAAFEGRVVDAAGAPQPGAAVHVLGRTGEAVTDGDGRFEWTPDPPTPFEVQVTLRGGALMKPVLVAALDPAAPLLLAVEPALIEEIVVSGLAPSIESTPAAGTTLLNAAEIEVRQPSNLIQILENVAGVNQVSEGQAAVPAIRGLFGGRTLILIDGARVTSERRVGPSATFLDPTILESVEVSRGPGGVAYGSDAFGGVISVQTRRVEPGSGLAARFHGTVGTAGLPERRLSLELSHGMERSGFLLAAHAREADDWESPEGEVFNSGYRDYGLLARGERPVGRGLLRASWQGDFGRDIERPRDNSRTVRFYYPEEESRRLAATYELPAFAGFAQTTVSGFFGTFDQTTDQDRFATATAGRSIERAVVDADDFHLRGSGERHLSRSRLELGIDANGRFDLHALEGRIAYDLAGNEIANVTSVAIDDADRLDTGVYASVDSSVGSWLTLGGGLRGDSVESQNSGGFFGDRSTSHGALSGFFAVTAGSFHGLTATAQIARGFRDPTLSDRYFRGPTGRGFITGNPDLDPETSLQLDLALRYTASRFRAGAFYYHYRIEDLIERYQTTTDSFFFRNRGEARLQGFELEAQADLGAGFALELAAQVAEGEVVDDGSSLDGITPFTVSAQLRRPLGERAFAQLRAAYFADDDEPGPTEREVPGYTLLDVAAGYEVLKWLELRILGRNLLDEAYLASQDVRAVLAPGRSVAFAVRLEL